MAKHFVLVGGVILGTLALTVGLGFLGTRSGRVLGTRSAAGPIDDVTTACVQHTGLGMHIHPNVRIVIKGEEQTIPANIGIQPGCMRPIHTHDDSGTLHLEFPGEQDVRLGQFFAVWGKTFNKNCIFDRCNSPEGTVKFFVNGQPNEEHENYPMKDGDKIEIRYE